MSANPVLDIKAIGWFGHTLFLLDLGSRQQQTLLKNIAKKTFVVPRNEKWLEGTCLHTHIHKHIQTQSKERNMFKNVPPPLHILPFFYWLREYDLAPCQIQMLVSLWILNNSVVISMAANKDYWTVMMVFIYKGDYLEYRKIFIGTF